MTATTSFEPPTPEQDGAVLASVSARLMEHFDSALIVVTRHAGGTSMTRQFTAGNWYANFGATKEWVTAQEERARVHVRQEND